MDVTNTAALVTGGASGLGLATAERLHADGARVTILDLPTSDGEAVARARGFSFAPADVADADAVTEAVTVASEQAPLRALVHCAGRGGLSRVVERDGSPGDREVFAEIVRVNLVGTFTVLSVAAAAMTVTAPVDGERGVCVLTSSVAAWEGQVGQAGYAASKAGIVGLTLLAARDLARAQVRVVTIAPGVFDTPILARLSDEVKDRLAAGIPHPSRLGRPEEYADMAAALIRNPMVNGETIRLDGAIRMAPR
ncbi:SDR family NAD(P)-dependent oxidoreductase [Phycicoccus sp. DTK01]|uniref:SDR family NAD(P)-dependent oxidoreductase n=1 Tax=Phycicoccus sp. DTK01 TaxID=2785745 RepID=UPI001A8DBFB2|nr:SDR family NAD(P)-dependent oxidoreductase [Phycicoccus sp. DTK01]GIL34108.1 3-hydroxy-2-methylbutyryl-CoA dehydrogenase [Phycicoccus sp. DTK01]